MVQAGSTEYRVRLELFEGPLDLLLYLIRRAEVSIVDIPIGQITEQYLAYIGEELGDQGQGNRVDIEKAGEFLVMAATLMEIKSRMVSPSEEDEEERADEPERGSDAKPAEDPRADLIRQLLEYKKYRDAADALDARRLEWERRAPAGGAVVGKEQAPDDEAVAVDLEDVELVDLVRAFARIAETVDFRRVGEHRVTLDETPIEVHAERVLAFLRDTHADSGATGVTLDRIVEGKGRGELIGVFLAMLELVRQRRVRVKQELGEAGGAGGIVLLLRDDQQEPGEEDAGDD